MVPDVALVEAIELAASPESTDLAFVCEGGVKDGALPQFVVGPSFKSVGDGSVRHSTLSHSQHTHTGVERTQDTKIVHCNQWQDRLHWMRILPLTFPITNYGMF